MLRMIYRLPILPLMIRVTNKIIGLICKLVKELYAQKVYDSLLYTSYGLNLDWHK